MAKVFIEESSLSAIANAIRGKTGGSTKLTIPTGMVTAINSIETGGVIGEKQEITLTENGTYIVPDGVIVTAIHVNIHNHTWSAPYEDPSYNSGFAKRCTKCGEVVEAWAQPAEDISFEVGDTYNIHFDIYEADIKNLEDAIVNIDDTSVVSYELDDTDDYYVVLHGLKVGSTTVTFPQLSKVYNVTVTASSGGNTGGNTGGDNGGSDSGGGSVGGDSDSDYTVHEAFTGFTIVPQGNEILSVISCPSFLTYSVLEEDAMLQFMDNGTGSGKTGVIKLSSTSRGTLEYTVTATY